MNPGNATFRWDGANWTFIPPPPNATPSQTSASAEGTVYLTDSTGLLYVRNGDAWRKFDGVLTQIAASAADRYYYDDPGVVQSPGSGWSRQVNTNAGAGGYLQSAKAGDAITLKFTGDSFSLHRLMGPTGGWATVTVDGRSMGTIDFYAAQPAWYVPAVLEGLGAGEHTLVLTVSPFKTAASTGTQVNLDSICAPAPQKPLPYQEEALAAVNRHRAAIGIPLAKFSTALNLSAQAHARYMAVNNSFNHDETAAGLGFTGVGPSDRARYFGYDVFLSSIETITNNADAENAVAFWANTIYHRTPIQDYYFTDIGFGATNTPRGMAAMNYGSRSRPALLTERRFVTFPGNNQRDVPIGYTVDTPDPRLADPTTLGYVISMTVLTTEDAAQGSDAVPFAATLTDSAGRSVPVFAITKANDPYPSLHPDDYFVMIPRERLMANTTYTARMVGTDMMGNRFDVTWTFTTVPNSAITTERPIFTLPATGNATALVNFTTAGPVDLTQISVAYGPTTALGRTARPATAEGTNRFGVELLDLPRGSLAYYRITATDAQGRTSTSRLTQMRVP